MTSRYTQAMHTLRFTEKQVDEIQRAVAARVASEDAGSETGAPLGMPVTPPRRSRALKRLVTALVAAAVLLSAGGLAVATGNGRVDIPTVFEELIGVPAEQVEGAPGLSALLAAEPIASVTSDGITVTLEAVFGDSHVISMLFTVEREDGKPLVRKGGCSKNGWVTFGRQDVGVESETFPGGYLPLSGSSRDLDLDPSDNAVQFLHMAHGNFEALEGKNIKVDLRQLVDGSARTCIAEGEWTFVFAASPSNTQRTAKVNRMLVVDDALCTISRVTVTPFSVSVSMDYISKIAPGGQLGTHAGSGIHTLPLCVTLANGETASRYHQTFWGGGGGFTGISDYGYEYESNLVAYLDRIIDPAEVVSVTIGNLVIPLD